MPNLSVIVPVYNVAQYLERCVNSILEQSYNDLEIILIDDGSTDDCPVICDDFAEKSDRIHVIHQKNAGLSAARNAGIDWAVSNSNSVWLGFVDSDDWIHPDMYRFLMLAAVECQTKISICDFIATLEMEAFPHYEKCSWLTCYGLDLFFSPDYSVAATIACNKIYHKELFRTERYPVGKIHEDEFTTHRLLFAAGNVAFVDTQLYYYFQRSDSIVHSKYSLKRLDAVEAIEHQRAFFYNLNDYQYRIMVDKKLLGIYESHIRGLKSIGAQKEYADLKKKAKTLLKKVSKETEYPISEYEVVYYSIRPFYTRCYRLRNHIYGLLKSKGFVGTLRYYSNKHLKKVRKKFINQED